MSAVYTEHYGASQANEVKGRKLCGSKKTLIMGVFFEGTSCLWVGAVYTARDSKWKCADFFHIWKNEIT